MSKSVSRSDQRKVPEEWLIDQKPDALSYVGENRPTTGTLCALETHAHTAESSRREQEGRSVDDERDAPRDSLQDPAQRRANDARS